MEEFAQLKAGGVPLGPLGQTDVKVDWAAVARTVREWLLRSDLGEREHLALVAWLSALQTHFPTQAAALQLTQSFERPNDGRYFKLRRIAIERLSQLI